LTNYRRVRSNELPKDLHAVAVVHNPEDPCGIMTLSNLTTGVRGNFTNTRRDLHSCRQGLWSNGLFNTKGATIDRGVSTFSNLQVYASSTTILFTLFCLRRVCVCMCVCAARFLAHFLRYTRKIRYWRGRRGCPSVRPSVCQHNSPVLKISIPDFCIKFCTHGRETLLKEIGIPFLIGSPIISLTNCLTIAHRNRVGSWKTGRADKSILRHYNRERIWRHPDGNYSH
jgi:hypothetical protein